MNKLYPEDKQQRPVAVYVVSHGWHACVAFKAHHLRAELPEHDQLPATNYYMVGWGDNRYYPAESPGVGLFLRAALLPTGSLIHVVAFDKTVDEYFPNSKIVRVQVSERGMKAMGEHIAERFSYNPAGELQYVIDGLYQQSAFLKADALYYFPRTSNWWAARILRESGLPITPVYAITSGNLMHQARKSGKIIQQQ